MNIRKISSLDEKELKEINIISKLLYFLFQTFSMTLNIKSVNYPEDDDKVIYAMWHSDQLAVHGIPKNSRSKTNILISQSYDGEIVARIAEKWGFKTIRGSENKNARTGSPTNKGGTKAAFDMIERINNGDNVSIMVDGPRGPLHKIKNGIVNIAKHTNARVVPVVWYSPDITFLHLPSWDKMTIPIWFTRVVALFGNPICLNENPTKEDEQLFKDNLKNELLKLGENAPYEWEKLFTRKHKNEV